MTEPVLIKDEAEWASYKDALDISYKHRHGGIPEKFPCIVLSTPWDDPNGPYCYDHDFVYVEIARELISVVDKMERLVNEARKQKESKPTP